MNLFPEKMTLLTPDISAYIAEKSIQNIEDQKSISEINDIYNSWACHLANFLSRSTLGEFTNQIEKLNGRFRDLFNVKYCDIIPILDYFVDLYYFTQKDKVYARFFKNTQTPPYNANMLMSLPEFILYFVNPEGAYILEKLTFELC